MRYFHVNSFEVVLALSSRFGGRFLGGLYTSTLLIPKYITQTMQFEQISRDVTTSGVVWRV